MFAGMNLTEVNNPNPFQAQVPLSPTWPSEAMPPLGCAYFVGFNPLLANDLGIAAISKYAYPPFVDGSCRREPDFDHPKPIITALCRKGMFAPRLKPGDVVFYLNNIGTRKPLLEYHLVAVLQVTRRVSSHEKAADLYRKGGFVLPNNCMVGGSEPHGYDQTIGPPLKQEGTDMGERFKETVLTNNAVRAKGLLAGWDKQYWGIAHDAGNTKLKGVAFTNPHYVDLHKPKMASREMLRSIFDGKVPGLLNPKAYRMEKGQALLAALGLPLIK